MKQLNHDAYTAAANFISKMARPLERALFQYFFEGGSIEDVFIPLSQFQNDDGGFGHGLEPDLRAPSSSPLATAIGLDILAALDTPAESLIVGRAGDYLRSTYEESYAAWIPVSADANRYPHAPWWHDEDGTLANIFDNFRIIPRAQIVGLFHHFRGLAPPDWLDPLTESAVTAVESVPQLGTGGGDDLRYALHLAEARHLPDKYRTRLTIRIREVLPNVIDRDPQAWSSYGITPLKVAPSPDSIAADLIWDEIQRYLDYMIDRQQSDGSWHPTWSWGDQYPEAWREAKIEWQGVITLEALRSLSLYGRLEK